MNQRTDHPTDDHDLVGRVRDRYARVARQVSSGDAAACCGSGAGADCGADPVTSDLYREGDLAGLPRDAVLASLGCGNPTALADLEPGQTVLDLGSGGGIDVLLSARRVGPGGKAYGLDMTDEMLDLARSNQQRAGVTNAEFLRGRIEDIPLPDGSVDVIISNCVINLSADKDRVLAEAFRVLKPGGRLAVSDIVVRRPLPEVVRRNMELWIGCLAGALEESDYRARLAARGFEEVDVEPTRIYTREDAAMLSPVMDGEAPLVDEVAGAFMSAFIRARKPGGCTCSEC